jgi:uncharacterized protein YceK
MKKMTALALCVGMLAILAGCTSVSTTTRLNDMRMGTPKTNQLLQINAEIWGVYLFGFIPLFAGNASTPGSTTIFANTVRLDYSVLLATNAARNMDASKIEAMNTLFSSTTLFPFLLTQKSIQVSLTASK